MAFHGDASQIPIANIVQALFMNGQEGQLFIEGNGWTRRLRVLKEGIRPLSLSPDDLDLLSRVLIKERLVTEREFLNVFSGRDPARPYPGDFLLQRRVITPEQVENEIRRQFEEVLFEIFSAEDVSYEFSAGVDCTSFEFFDPEGAGGSLLFSVNGILMESVRREDDWRRIRELVPNRHEVFQPVHGSLPGRLPEDAGISERSYRPLRHLLNGDRTVERIIEDSPLSSYEVHHAIFVLRQRELVRPLDAGEKQQLAERLRKTGKTAEAIDVYSSILDGDPDNTIIRREMVRMLEKDRKLPRVLIEQYLQLAEQVRSEDSQEALSCVGKVLQIDPSCLAAHEQRALLLASLGQQPEAVSATRALIRQIKASERHQEGAAILERVLPRLGPEPGFCHDLADLFLAIGKNDRAVEYLKASAAIWEQRKDFGRLRKTYELIAKLDPAERSQLARISAVACRVRLRPRDLARTTAITVFLTVVFFILARLVMTEISSRRLYAQAQGEVEMLVDQHDYDRALEVLDDFDTTFPLSTVKSRVADLRETVVERRREDSLREKRSQEKITLVILSALGKAERLIESGRFEEALRALQEVSRQTRDLPIPESRRGARQKLEKKIGQLRAYFASAGELAARAAREDEAGRAPNAHSLYLELARKYPFSPAARHAKVPVTMATEPAGARVRIGTRRLEGETPLVIRVDPRSTPEVTFERPGYRSRTVRVIPSRSWSVRVRLDKDREWRFVHEGPCEGFPVSDGKLVYFANRDGLVICLDLRGNEVWRHEIPDRADVSGGLGLWKGRLFMGAFDGRLHVLDARSGVPRGNPVAASADALPIKEAPSASSAAGIVVVNCGGRSLSGIDLTGPRRVWTRESPDRLLGPPRTDGEIVYAFAGGGKILRCRHDSGRPLPPFALHAPLEHPGTVADGRAFVALQSGQVQAIDLSNGETVWLRRLPASPTATPTVSIESGIVVIPVVTRDMVCLDIENGAQRWAVPAGGPIETEGLIFRGRLYIGSRDGWITCRNVRTGNERWRFATEGASASPPRGILCPGTVSQGRFYQGSDDGRFYCLTLD